MTKRTRRDREKEDLLVPIGASEFAMIVNQQGPKQDPSTLLGALERFVRTVQRDRRITAGREEDHDDTDSLSGASSCDSIFDSAATKRSPKKVEAWKEDSAAYGVPFVGTSVASIRSDPVIPGQWPTGLLKAYLAKSPLAIELTGETLNYPKDFYDHGRETRRNIKLLEAIQKADLLALSELCTAAIPLDLTGQRRKNDEEPRFVSEMLSKRLPHLLSLLGEETNNGKGRSTIVGGCGALVAPILNVMERLALISTRTARYVARSIEQSVSESVVRFILTQQQTQRRERHPHQAMEIDPADEIDHNSLTHSSTHREKAQVAALQLAVTLASIDDPVVFSCITSTASTKDGKIRRGILFLSLQRGVQFDGVTNPGYFRAVARLLVVVRGLLGRVSVSKRLLSDLFSSEFVQKLVHFSMQAPPLSTSVSFLDVLAGTDNYRKSDGNAMKGNETAREEVAVEARRLLFVLLGDTERSPLLHSLSTSRSAQLPEQCIVRAIVQLLDCSDDPAREIRRFVVYITNLAPSLFPAIMRMMPLPDERRPFALIARLNGLSTLLRDGPAAATCFVATGHTRSALSSHKVDAVMLGILPLALRRQVFAKLIQSRSHLVGFVSLNFYLVVLERCRNFLADLVGKNVIPEDDIEFVTEALARGLPDQAMLIAALSKLDFGKRADAVLFGYICEGIRAYSTVFGGRRDTAKFDWTKLLPGNPAVFCSAPVFLQKIILISIRATLSLQKTLCVCSSSSNHIIGGIVLRTHSVDVFQLARSILVDLVSRLLSRTGSDGELGESRMSWKHEAECWVDGMNHSTAGDLCRLIQVTSLVSTPMTVSFLRMWRDVGLESKSFPGVLPSRILAQALGDLPRSSKDFALLTIQVTCKCLLFDNNPTPLATLILANRQELETEHVGSLVALARSIAFGGRSENTAKLLLAKQILKTCFSTSSSPLNFFTNFSSNTLPCSLPGSKVGKRIATYDISALIRYSIHFASTSNETVNNPVFDLLARLLPAGISASITLAAPPPLPFQSLVNIWDCFRSRKFFAGCILTSGLLPLQMSPQFTEQSTKVIFADNAASKTLRELLYLYVIGPLLPAEALVPSVMSLLPEGRNADFYSGKAPEGELLRHYLQLTTEKVEWKTFDRLKALKLFLSILPFWLSFTDVHLSDRTLYAIAKECEVLLGLALSHGCSPIVLRRMNSDILLQQCLLTKLFFSQHQVDMSSDTLMALLIDTDPVRFGPSFLRLHMRRVRDTKYVHIFHLGFLDQEIRSIFGCQGFEKPLEAVASFGTLLDLRSQAIYSSNSKSSLAVIEDFLSALLAFTVDSKILERVPVAAHILLAITMLNENGVAIINSGNWSRMQKILLLTLRLCRQKIEGIPSLASLAFVWCTKALALALNESDADSATAPGQLMRYLMELIAVNHSYDEGLLGLEASRHLSSLTRSCLRYSLEANGDDRQSNRVRSLQLVEALVHCMHDKNNNPHLSELASFLPAPFGRTVFELLTSHSKFTDVLCGSSSHSGRSASLETLRLMKTCLTATNEINFDEKVWSQLLACYGAGVSEKDILVRWILNLFAAKAPSNCFCTTISQLRWGSVVDYSVGWDWLVESIDLRRVYATLECFPVQDRLALKSDQLEVKYRLHAGPSEGNGFMPYSPGFLLPLVLQALEEEEKDRKLTAESEAGCAAPWKGKASGLMFAQRLSDKGGLALAFASLCSNDASVRKVAASVLCAFLENVGSSDALKNPYWRDRPQLAMILNAVQRSLVIRHGRGSDKSGGTARPTSFVVPKLPGFSAVFLGRASLILSRPTDPMFVVINRALLRSESDFGAFQDLTRVPVFVSLFCSASSNPEQLKMERKFSLDLVRDGITEEEDYRLLMACHCPELLLTSLGRICPYSSMEQDDESCLILKTLSKLIEIGGDHAASHIIDRMGLLSWLRSLLSGVNITTHIQSRSARTEALFLLANVLRRANGLLPTSELVAATSGMAQSVISMTIDSLDFPSVNSGRVVDKSNQQLIQQACEVLTLLQVVFSNSKSDKTQVCYQPDGFLMVAASQFLSVVATPEELETAVCALCILPINDRIVDCSLVEAFCVKILTLVTSTILPKLRRQTMAAVLRRLSALSDACTENKGRQKFLDLLLALWTSCALDSELREAWYQCLDVMILSRIGGSGSYSAFVGGTNDDDLASFLFRIQLKTFDEG